jgi:hypothetical protein
MLLMTGYGLCFPIFIAFEMNLLQYVTARFNWEWSTVSFPQSHHDAVFLIGLGRLYNHCIKSHFRDCSSCNLALVLILNHKTFRPSTFSQRLVSGSWIRHILSCWQFPYRNFGSTMVTGDILGCAQLW